MLKERAAISHEPMSGNWRVIVQNGAGKIKKNFVLKDDPHYTQPCGKVLTLRSESKYYHYLMRKLQTSQRTSNRLIAKLLKAQRAPEKELIAQKIDWLYEEQSELRDSLEELSGITLHRDEKNR